MRKFLAFLFLLLLVAAAWMAHSLLVPVGPNKQTFVEFRQGSSARHIATDLKNAGLIRSRVAFLLLHLYERKTLKAGEYEFDHPATAAEIYSRIARGDTYARVLSVPEGFNMFDIALAVEHAGIASQQEFLEQARRQTELVRDIDPQTRTLEGYLFPDTYRFARKQGPADVVIAMVKRFRQEARMLGLNSNVHNTVTMASIVEKETAVPEERSLVAGVFENRIANHMPLATDPSVIYAALLAGRYRGAIYQSDLQFKSPYNTYHVAGLPPGPISNPGKDSLLAAMHPTETDYLYFVSDNQGHHRFARTYAEHEQNVQAYRAAVNATR
jgi:peptidoglycan lytic transglycosylase G